MRQRIAVKSPRSRLFPNPARRDPKPFGKFFCREQFELLSHALAPQTLPAHISLLQFSKLLRLAVWPAAAF
jgi:hypothetical protein